MKRSFPLTLVLLSLFLAGSCKKNDGIPQDIPMMFNLFIFNQEGQDLVNPSNPTCLDSSKITIESIYEGETVNWVVGRRSRYYDDPNTTVDLSGFYYFEISTNDVFLGWDVMNATMDCTIHIDGFPDSATVFHFNEKGCVDRIEVNGKRVMEGIHIRSYNVKLNI